MTFDNKTFVFTLILFALLSVASINSHASSIDEANGIRIEKFAVEGRTPREVRAFLNAHGPLGEDGRHYDAYTEWEIQWRWPVIDNRPVFEQMTVQTKIKVLLPEWVAPSQQMQNEWDSYLEQIKEHEAGHVQQARFHAEKMENVLRAYHEEHPGLSAQEANKIARRIVMEARRTDEIYDDTTSHGRLQGVRWPPPALANASSP